MAVAAQASFPTGKEHQRRSEEDAFWHKVPAPIYRHATPSAPWPWMKFGVDASKVHPVPPGLPGKLEWSQYPQSCFQNWTHEQVNRSQMLTGCSDAERSTVYKMNIFDDGSSDNQIGIRTVHRADAVDLRSYWDDLGMNPPLNVRVQALFVDDMTTSVLQILGARYNIEPFFFASSTNWIPSRYQEDPKALEDHITVVLPFIRTLKKNQQPITRTKRLKLLTSASTELPPWESVGERLPYTKDGKQSINTQIPLSLPNNKILFQDLLSLHMVRTTTTSTVISYHHSFPRTSARRLQTLMQRTGDSVYWSNIFKISKDPTFHLLVILWYALYAWDEAFEVLFRYINALESEVLRFNNLKLTRELHKLQAHVLYYQQLLREFHRSVEFVRNTPNPAMSAPSISDAERESSADLMHAEADNLISEIERLSGQREMLSERLDNVINLAFATVNIEESKAIRKLAEITMKDSSAIKQITWLTMIFLPATYMANVFSMNVQEINKDSNLTLTQYIEAVAVLTLFTSWLVIALQKDSFFFPSDSGVIHRTLWPLYFANGVISTEIKRWRFQLTDCRSSSDNQPPYSTSDKK